MKEKVLENVQRLKYKTTFLKVYTVINEEGNLKKIDISGPVLKSEQGSFRSACMVINTLLDKNVFNKQYIISTLRRTRGIDSSVLMFIESLLKSSMLSLR